MKYKEVILSLVILVTSTVISLFTPMTIFATECVRKISETNSFEEYESKENLNIVADEERLIIENGVLISYEGNAEKVIIPDDVISIGVGAFSWCDNLKEVVVPNSVTSIESEAFLWCSNLKEINIPDSVVSIGDRAFVDCASLTEIMIPDSVISIGQNVFDIEVNPGTVMKYTQVDDSYYWVDDSNSVYYNQFVSTNAVKKDWKSAEHIVDYKTAYRYVLALDYNVECISGVGSAIFLHCSSAKPTAGCIAVPERNMIEILKNVQEKCVVIIDSEENLSNY